MWQFRRIIVSLQRSNYKVKQKYKTATAWGMGQPPQGSRLYKPEQREVQSFVFGV